MSKKISLQIIFAIAIVGLLFSGYLSYGELVAKQCPVGGCSALFGLPVCIYGFGMYLVIFIVALLGLWYEKKR